MGARPKSREDQLVVLQLARGDVRVREVRHRAHPIGQRVGRRLRAEERGARALELVQRSTEARGVREQPDGTIRRARTRHREPHRTARRDATLRRLTKPPMRFGREHEQLGERLTLDAARARARDSVERHRVVGRVDAI